MRPIGTRNYHHGNLRRAILDAAVEAIGESGIATWSLRELARRAGVSHAAPTHHFGDKAGLLTALAAEGFEHFAAALEAAGDDFLDVGVAYVRFAVEHKAHFEVMFRPELYDADAPEVVVARERAGRVLAEGARTLPTGGIQARPTSLAAWSMAHGFAELWLSGALPRDLGDDAAAAVRPVLGVLTGVLHEK